MKLLMIDNYDSFTWNLVQYLGQLGHLPHVIRNDEWSVEEVVHWSPDALVISPGPCTPTEAGISVPIIKRLSGEVPILGVCLGHQSIGAAFGGDVVRAHVIMHGKTSPVRHEGEGLFSGLASPFEATRYHSLVLDPGTLPECLIPTAWTDDPGGCTLMGIAHRVHATWGVQFHPESILTAVGMDLLQNFITLARQRPPRVQPGASSP
jgi:anthranilate synthase component 2